MFAPIKNYHSNGIKKICSIVLFLLGIFCTTTSESQDLAFPTATGAGAFATGGRGKPVYTVTNLNNSGPGSFRQCLENTKLTDGGIIVFAVSGTINLTSEIYFYNQDNITIAGQTAPEGGIAIANYRLRFQNVNNLIMRYIRLRPDYPVYPASEIDAFEIFQCSNYIIDHCSFSWGTDESVGSGVGNTYTWQRNIFAESKTGMIMGGEASASYNLSFNNNLFYHCSHRFPNWNSNGRVDVINNVIWNWRSRMSVPSGGFEVNHINNYYVHYTSNPVPDTDIRGMLWYPNTTHFPTIYTNGNYISDVLTDPNADNWFFWRFRFNPSGTPYSGAGNESPLTPDFRTMTPFQLLGQEFSIKTAAESLENVSLDVGANARLDGLGQKFEDIDMVDNEYLTNVQNGIIVPYTQDDVLDTQHHDDYLNTVSSVPINSRPSGFDSDGDGMPDDWEINRFGNLANNGTVDTDGTGYTDVEDYLNSVDAMTADTTGSQVTLISNDDDNTLCQGEEVILTASDADSYTWNHTSSTASSLTESPNTTTTYVVTGTHSDGSTTTAEITIVVNDLPTAEAGDDVEICQGTSVTLTASGGTSYLWSNGATSASTVVNPNETETFSVEVFNDNNCSSSDSVLVTVSPLPTVDAGEDQTIFEGESATLIATGADTYLWSTGETTPTITVNPILDTSYTVTGFVNGCEHTDGVTVFTLDDSVNADAGEDIDICIGESTTLTATGGSSYLWNTGETTSSITVAPSTTTTFTVTAFSPSGNNQDNDEITVTVNAIPVALAGDDVEICSGESTILTASGGTSYLWSTGETSQSISVSPTSTTIYTVAVFENNCSSEDEVQVSVNELPNVDAGNDVTIIEGESTTLTASGADTYLWSTGETTASIEVSPNNTTTYSATGFINNCEATSQVVVTVIMDDANANAGEDVTICEGETATLTASGGTSYLWSTGETTASINVSPSATTTYTVTAFSPSGNNQNDDSVTVTVNAIPTANAGDDVEICSGESTILTASGGTSYLWSTGETSQSISVSPTSTTVYTVEVFENNCSTTDDIQVTVNPLPNVNAGNNVTITEGESTTLTATGADTYLWSTGETTASIEVSPNSTTTYSVTGFSNGCEATDDVTVAVNVEEVTADAGEDVEICNGESTILTASGGTTYLWNTGETTASITVNPNSTTTYTVTAFNSTLTASDEDSVIVTVNAIPTANAGDDVEICLGSSTTLTASGGTSYLWSTGETTQSIIVSPSSSTIYYVEVFENNCSAIDDVQVAVNPLPNVNAGNNVTINEGESTTLTASGSDTYLWSTGETTASIEVSPNSTTTYSVTGFSNGCEATDDVTVAVNVEQVTADAGNDVEICNGESTILTASGGTTYLWNTGETTASITVNPNSTTTYTVTAYNSALTSSDEDSVTVTVNELPNVSAGNNVTINEGESTTLTATGADTYLWSTGETTASIEVSPNSTTTYSVTGFSNGCEATDDVTVAVTVEQVTADAGDDVEICNGESTILTASGGTTYLWNTGETTASITVNPNSTTTYTVTAFNSTLTSSDEDSVTVTVNELPNVSAGNNVTITEGETTTLTASGAESYVWSTGETTTSIEVSPNSTTTYSVTGFSNGCEATDDVTVAVNVEQVTADAGEDVEICNGESTILTASGGTTYLWNTGETTASITVNPNSTTTYTVSAFNSALTSSDEDSVTVTVNELPNVSAGNNVTITEGESTTLTASGADTYLWSTGETTTSIEVSPNSTTTYSVTGFSNGCEATDDVTVAVNVEQVTADAGEDVEICNGESTILTASGGTTYLWNTGETTASITVNPNSTTTYTVTAFNSALTSSDEDSVTVTVNELPNVSAGNNVTITEGESTTLTASGADTYLWSTGETTASIVVSPNSTTTYSVTGFSNGCQASDDITITVNPFEFEASAGVDRSICQGYETTLTASEGDSYLWSTGETTQSITVNPSNTQTYTVTIFIGDYQANADVTVSVNPNPNVVITNGSDVMILEGEFVTLGASGANTYLWNNGITDPFIAVSPSITTTYEVTGYINDCEDTKAVQVNVIETVEADAGQDVVICANETVTLTASGGDEYLWSTGETTQSIQVSPDSDTEYSVLAYNILDSDEATVRVFVEQCTTVEEIPLEEQDFDFIAYQDSETELLNIKVDGIQDVKAKGITIYDLTGKVLYTELFDQEELENELQVTREIRTDLYASGIYMVRLKYDDTSVVKKIPIR